MPRFFHKIWGIISLTLLAIMHSAAQVRPIIEHYSTENGLPNDIVYGALRDSDGFLWICTWHGIAVYDGYTFRPLVKRAEGRGDIPPRKVSKIIDDGKGHLWMRNVDNGFYMFDKKSEAFTNLYPYMRPIADNLLVRKIKDIGEGRILFITRDKNLYMAYADSSGKPIITKLYDARSNIDKETMNLKHAVHGTSHGYMFWITMNMDIYAVRQDSKDIKKRMAANSRRHTEEWERMIPQRGDSLMPDIKYCDAGQHGIFILSKSGHLYHYDRKRHRMTNPDDAGLAELNAGKQTFHDIFIDQDSDIWLSSTRHGLFKITFPTGRFNMLYPDLFQLHYDDDNTNIGIRALFRTKNGMLLIGCRGGRLKVVNPQTGTVVYTFDEYIQNIYHIMQDHTGAIWLSSKGHGLFKVTPVAGGTQYTCENFRHDPKNPYSISTDRVYYTKEDHEGRIWVATFGGGVNLMEVVNGTTIFHNHVNTFKKYPHGDLYINVRAIEEDRDNTLWASTTNGLIRIKLDNGGDLSETQFYTSRKIGEDIYSMYRDTNGNIWLGIMGNGLNKITGYDEHRHRPVLQRYGDDEMWRCNTISTIAQDSQGDLWICTDYELASLDTKTGAIHNYDHYTGFPPVHIEDNTVAMLPNGNLLLGCKEGLLSFSPEQLKRSTGKKYNTFIVDMRVLNRDLQDFQPSIYDNNICYADTIVLKHDQNMFSLKFATLKFSSHSQLSYTYILEGYEQHRHISDNSNVASYSNIPPGEYTFKVRAIGDDYPERKLTIIVRSPWWATWWAYTIYALALIILAYGVFRLVTYIIRMRNEIYIHKRMDTIKKQVLRQHAAEKEHEFVAKVTRLVEDNISQDMSVDTIAEEMGLSRSAFFKRIKTLTGKAPVDFIKDIRLAKAAKLITTTDLGITEIAYQVGFSDPGYFGKCFRKKFEMTPKEYRNQATKA